MIGHYEFFVEQIEKFQKNPTTSGAKGLLMDINQSELSDEEKQALIKMLKA